MSPPKFCAEYGLFASIRQLLAGLASTTEHCSTFGFGNAYTYPHENRTIVGSSWWKRGEACIFQPCDALATNVSEPVPLPSGMEVAAARVLDGTCRVR